MLLKLKDRQRGFSLLEALLAIVIILAAGLGVVELFISADKRNKVNSTQQVVQQAGSAASQLISASYGDTSAATTQTVINSGLMSSSYVSSDGKSIVAPYGSVVVGQNGNSTYYIVATNVPGDQAVSLCQNMFASAAVYNSGTSAAAPGTTFITSVSDCANKTTGFGGKSNSKVYIGFAFPRENYVTNATA